MTFQPTAILASTLTPCTRFRSIVGRLSRSALTTGGRGSAAIRLTCADWYPIARDFVVRALATKESCTASHCNVVGLELEISNAPMPHRPVPGLLLPDGRVRGAPPWPLR